MRTALITTTINEPRVLALYRALGADVAMFVAADEKTPLAAYELCANLGDCEIYSPERQKELGYECSPLLGWNNDSRRDIALLEAVKHGAELIVSCDDDMVPVGSNFFAEVDRVFTQPFSGLQLGTPGQWFDAGKFTMPAARQRGLPVEYVEVNSFNSVFEGEIGAMQGIILGVPDTDAANAIANQPIVLSATDILRHGFVIEPKAKSVFNSQLTVFRRELAPCFAQFYNWQGRNTDIFASMLMRRVMREHNYHTYFGPPFGFHARSSRPLLNDLKAELWGMERIERFADLLDSCILPPGSVLDNCRHLYRVIGADQSPEFAAVALAFLDDVEKVL